MIPFLHKTAGCGAQCRYQHFRRRPHGSVWRAHQQTTSQAPFWLDAGARRGIYPTTTEWAAVDDQHRDVLRPGNLGVAVRRAVHQVGKHAARGREEYCTRPMTDNALRCCAIRLITSLMLQRQSSWTAGSSRPAGPEGKAEAMGRGAEAMGRGADAMDRGGGDPRASATARAVAGQSLHSGVQARRL